MLNVELGTKFFKLLIIKLPTIYYNNSSGQAEYANNRVSNEAPGLGLSDLCHWFGFYPFGKVVNGHKEKLPLLRS